VFDRYGVQRVADMDELATALIMFAQPHAVPDGGLVSIHDSGGERQLALDRADALGVPFAELAPSTIEKLEDLLDPGLPAVNPLDAWSRGGPDFHIAMSECLSAMLSDPAAALGAVIHDRGPDGRIYEAYVDYMRAAHRASGKPVFLVSNHQGSGSDPLAVAATREGFPVLDGLGAFLTGVKCIFDYRDFRSRAPMQPPQILPALTAQWRTFLSRNLRMDEVSALEMLSAFGIPGNRCSAVSSESGALVAARKYGYPVVLKSAAGGLAHKSEAGGVRLRIGSDRDLAAAYSDMAGRLGPKCLVAPMTDQAGLEMILGVIVDDQFGPVCLLGFGGVFTEAIRDVVFMLPPFDPAAARRAVDRLRLRPLLDAQRGRGPLAVDAYCEAAAHLSVLAHELGDVLSEIDVNPVIVTENACVAVDALIIPRAAEMSQFRSAAG